MRNRYANNWNRIQKSQELLSVTNEEIGLYKQNSNVREGLNKANLHQGYIYLRASVNFSTFVFNEKF